MRRRYDSHGNSESTDPQPIVAPVSDSSNEMTLHDILSLFLRHWFIVFAVMTVAIGGAVAYLVLVTPKFTALGQVLVAPPTIQADAQSAVGNQRAEIDDVPSEAALLRSRLLASAVIRQLGLDTDEEFAADSDLPIDSPARIDAVIQAFLENLSVEASTESRVIDVYFKSADPEKAAEVVNTLMDLYVANQLDYRRQKASQATERLENVVEELRAEVEEAEAAVRNYRTENNLLQGQGSDLTANRVTGLNAEVVAAQRNLTVLRTELAELESATQRNGSAATAPRVINSPLIQRLRDREVEVARTQAELSSQYGPRHPRMIQIANELKDVRGNIQTEIGKIVESLRSEVAAARAGVTFLRQQLEEVEAQSVQARGAEAKLNELVQEASDKREMLNNFRVRLRQTRATRDMIEPTARVYSQADTPAEPSSPQKSKTIAIAGFLGIIGSVVLVILIGSLRRTFESPDEVERMTRYRALGVVPRLTGVAGGRKTAQRIFSLYSEKPHAPFSQSMKGVRSTLYLANGSRTPKTVLVTSSIPGEGKTTFAFGYAALCASFGEKVVLLDCDFGRPDLHKKMGVSNDLGIANFLMGEVDLETVIRNDGRTGMDYITSGTLPPNATDLSRSSALKGILESLAWDYDVVVIDSAPVLAMSDSQILSTMVDATVFVVRWRKTRMDNVVAATARLTEMGAKSVAGFVLSNVDVPKAKSSHVASYYAAYHR